MEMDEADMEWVSRFTSPRGIKHGIYLAKAYRGTFDAGTSSFQQYSDKVWTRRLRYLEAKALIMGIT